jgi:predicted  nucleic acid-binding Zn-ribbon protein
MLTAEKSTLATEVDALKENKKMLQAEVEEGSVRVQQAERNLTETLAQLDRKRQKKRDYKAVASKFKRLWQSVCRPG